MKPRLILTSVLISFAVSLFWHCTIETPLPAPDPQELEVLMQQARDNISQGRFDVANTFLDSLLKLDPTHYKAHLGLGEIQMRQRRFEAALPHLEQARKIDPQRLEARFQLARTYRYLDRLAEALELFHTLTTENSGHIPSHLVYADILMTKAPPDPEGALKQYETVLTHHPNHLRAQQGAAASRLRLGDFISAATAMEKILAQRPNDPHLSFLLGTTYHWLAEYEKAIDAYKKALDTLKPDSPQRTMRQWNLRLAYLAARGQYPGDLEPFYQLHLAATDHPSPVHFEDVAVTSGVAKKDRGRGSAWGDYDNDGDLDLFTVGIQSPHSLYRNDGTTFASIENSAGLADPRGGWAAICADYNNDGNLDLYVTRDAWEGGGTNSLYQNQGNSHFIDIALESGTDDPDDSFTAAWGDYDNDGFVDLYIADGITGSGAANKLLHNQTNASFVDHAPGAGVDHTGKSLGVAWGDYDNDGDLDLYVVDVAGPNTLYHNMGNGTFTDITTQAGVASPYKGGYVAFFFDSDSDGDLDLFVTAMNYYEDFIASQITGHTTNSSRIHLYLYEGNNHFTEVAIKKGVARSFGSMGAGFGDVDYDGMVDIYLANGGPIMGRFEPNILYHNNDSTFVDITQDAGVGNLGKGHGATFADYDNDGDLDLYAGIGGHYPGDQWANSLYRNKGHNNHWLGIQLESTTSNRSAIGAQLILSTGNQIQRSEISSGGGFGSTNSLIAEFGLGKRNTLDRLDIRWPGGQTSSYRNLSGDQIHRFTETQ